MNKLKNNRAGAFLLIAISCLFIFFLAYQEVRSISEDNYKELLDKDTGKILLDINHIAFSNIEGVTRTLAEDSYVKSICRKVTKDIHEKVLTTLNTVRDMTKIDICYIMNSEGIVVSSSEYLIDRNIKIEGLDYSFRPYFFEAIKGKDIIYPALGITTNLRGLYFSSPIRDDSNNIIGVVTCKMNMEVIDEILKEYPYKVLISTVDGIVFSTNTNDLLYKTILPMNKQKLDSIIKSRQFLNNQITPLKLSIKNNFAKLNSGKYYVSEKKIGKTGWKITAFKNYRKELLLNPVQLRFVVLILIILIVFMLTIVLLVNNIFKRHESEAMTKKLFQAVQQSSSTVVITDINGIIEYVNPKFTELTGYGIGEAIGINTNKLKSGLHEDSFYQKMWTTILSGEDWKGDFCNKRKNGEIYWEESIISSVKDSKGKIENFICIKEDITKRRELDKVLEKYANTDEMTGVFNRRASMILMERQMQISKRQNESFSIFFMDINGLKSVNDTLGHSSGDELINLAVSVIKTCLRDSDSICRLGGDEFLVILPETNNVDSEIILKRIEVEVEKVNNEEKYPYILSLSFGQAEFHSDSELTVDDMIQMADGRMYVNKAEIKQKQGLKGIFR